MFDDVVVMNNKFGNAKGDPANVNWPRLSSQCSNILDEYKELQTALQTGNMVEVRDALCDILVFTLGAYHFAGYDADKDMRAVFDSNMSKFSSNEEELAATVLFYNAKNVQTYTGGEFPFKWVKSLRQQTGLDGKNYPEGKFLKNVNWKEPIFSN